jgi:hypothetical protein
LTAGWTGLLVGGCGSELIQGAVATLRRADRPTTTRLNSENSHALQNGGFHGNGKYPGCRKKNPYNNGFPLRVFQNVPRGPKKTRP